MMWRAFPLGSAIHASIDTGDSCGKRGREVAAGRSSQDRVSDPNGGNNFGTQAGRASSQRWRWCGTRWGFESAAERGAAPGQSGQIKGVSSRADGGDVNAERVLARHDGRHVPPANDAIARWEINGEDGAERKKRNPAGRRARKREFRNMAASRWADPACGTLRKKRRTRKGKKPTAVGTDNDAATGMPAI